MGWGAGWTRVIRASLSLEGPEVIIVSLKAWFGFPERSARPLSNTVNPNGSAETTSVDPEGWFGVAAVGGSGPDPQLFYNTNLLSPAYFRKGLG